VDIHRQAPGRAEESGIVAKLMKCGTRYFAVLHELAAGKASGQEIDDGPVIRRLIKRWGIMGVLLRGETYDAGNHRGYALANIKLTSRMIGEQQYPGESSCER